MKNKLQLMHASYLGMKYDKICYATNHIAIYVYLDGYIATQKTAHQQLELLAVCEMEGL